MKPILALAILVAAPVFAAENGAMTDAERAFLVDQLEQSKKEMLAGISGLTAAQWRFKPAPDAWSVAECAEHIILAEDYIFGFSQTILKSPAVERQPTSNAEVDQKIVAGVKDRSHKATAPEPIVPSGKFATPEEAAKVFTEKRDAHIEYAKSTTDELRGHMTDKSPMGPADAYQVLLLLSAHSARHTEQIREVESNEAYPKASASFAHAGLRSAD